MSGSAFTARFVCVLVSSLAFVQGAHAQLAGNALLFDGTNDQATIADSASLDLGYSATIELWIRPTTPPGTYQRFINKGDGATCDSNRAFELEIGPGQIAWDSFTGDCDGWTELVPSHTFLPDEWIHVAVVYDTANSRASHFINGALVAETTVTVIGHPISQPIFPTTFPLILSSWNGIEHFYAGEMDELRIWNVVRTPADIATNFNRLVAPDTSGLVGYWSFDEAIDDQHIYDSSPFGNHGLLGDSVSPASNDPTRIGSTAPIVPACPVDVNSDGQVGIGDLLILLAFWGPCGDVCLGDLDGDGAVTILDLLELLAAWGPCP